MHVPMGVCIADGPRVMSKRHSASVAEGLFDAKNVIVDGLLTLLLVFHILLLSLLTLFSYMLMLMV